MQNWRTWDNDEDEDDNKPVDKDGYAKGIDKNTIGRLVRENLGVGWVSLALYLLAIIFY